MQTQAFCQTAICKYFFSQFVACLFISQWNISQGHKFFILIKSHLLPCSFMNHAFGAIARKSFPNSRSQWFLCRSFVVMFYLQTYDAFWVTVVYYSTKYGSNFIFLEHGKPLLPTSSIKKIFFSTILPLYLYHKSFYEIYVNIFLESPFTFIDLFVNFYVNPTLCWLL